MVDYSTLLTISNIVTLDLVQFQKDKTPRRNIYTVVYESTNQKPRRDARR